MNSLNNSLKNMDVNGNELNDNSELKTNGNGVSDKNRSENEWVKLNVGE